MLTGKNETSLRWAVVPLSNHWVEAEDAVEAGRAAASRGSKKKQRDRKWTFAVSLCDCRSTVKMNRHIFVSFFLLLKCVDVARARASPRTSITCYFFFTVGDVGRLSAAVSCSLAGVKARVFFAGCPR